MQAREIDRGVQAIRDKAELHEAQAMLAKLAFPRLEPVGALDLASATAAAAAAAVLVAPVPAFQAPAPAAVSMQPAQPQPAQPDFSQQAQLVPLPQQAPSQFFQVCLSF